MSKAETGARWWIRYVVVPLIGGGGVVAIVVALVQKSDPVPHPRQPTASQATPSPAPVVKPAKESERTNVIQGGDKNVQGVGDNNKINIR